MLMHLLIWHGTLASSMWNRELRCSIYDADYAVLLCCCADYPYYVVLIVLIVLIMLISW